MAQSNLQIPGYIGAMKKPLTNAVSANGFITQVCIFLCGNTSPACYRQIIAALQDRIHPGLGYIVCWVKAMSGLVSPGQDILTVMSHQTWQEYSIKELSGTSSVSIPASSRSGVYIIQPKGLHHLVVYCEMNVTGGGWTVIQRNQKDTPVTWAESWSTYKYGFGNVRSEYWLGTEYIHQIAKQKVYKVRFVIQDSTDNTNFADYNLFSVEDESHGYRLRLGSYTGTAGDAMTSDNPKTMHDNMKFSTKDHDQDTYSKNCAYSYEGGWWYSACYSVRLNFKGGMTWGSLCKGNCKSSLILIKPAPYC
uniref:Fibrinogen C-terminal domain-containing protein n=1 Tax=Calidris pygmaea TaxID=425635 RepID=A0A8C3JSQ6_9CHAR